MSKVTLAYIHSDEVSTSFNESVMALVLHDAMTDQYLVHPDGKYALRCRTNGLVEARNAAVTAFLESGAEWLLWIDTDMGFAPDTLQKLMSVAHPVSQPIVGALCFASREVGTDGMGGHRTVPRATIYDWVPGPDGKTPEFRGRLMYPVNALVPCAATGSACILIHRSVFERISHMLVARNQSPASWYDQIPDPSGLLASEDISFCMRAGAANIPIAVCTAVRTTHLKPMWLGEQHFWAQTPAPPATEPVAVIVPVMGRPEHAEPFMASLRASSGLATVYAVCDERDTAAIAAWLAAGATVLTHDGFWPATWDDEQVSIQGRPGTFAEKVNEGYRQTSEPWLFIVGSDVYFWPGWLDHAQAVATAYGADVVGTNDLGNPRVLAGEHATHLLIRRSYVEQTGASWDGPGLLAHEGYRHWYVDDEIVTAARQRGVFQPALGARVEHLHPMFGKGVDDEVYRLGRSFADQDRALFEQRRADHA